MTSKKTVFFEDINLGHYPYLAYCLALGRPIFAFEYETNLKKKWICSLINSGRIKRIYFKPNTPQHSLAIDATEKVFQLFSNSSLIKKARFLYQNEKIDLVFKKSLVFPIFKTIFIHWYFSEYLPSERRSTSRFISTSFPKTKKWLDQASVQLGPLPVSSGGGLFRLFFLLDRLWLRFKYLAGLAALFLKYGVAFILGRVMGKGGVQTNFKCAIPVFVPAHMSHSGGRGVDLFISNGIFDPRETIFINLISFSGAQMENWEKKGYQFFDFQKAQSFSDLCRQRFKSDFLQRAVKAFSFNPFAYLTPLPILQSVYGSFRAYFSWKVLFSRLGFRHFVYSNLEGPEQAAVNLLIAAHGGKTWNYASFLGGGYIYDRGGDLKEVRHALWSFQYFDEWIGINETAKAYNKVHPQEASRYSAIGSFYADEIQRLSQSYSKKEAFQEFFGKPTPEDDEKLVAIFDTSFVSNELAPTTYEDAILFYQDLLRYLNERPKVYFLVKPSKDPGYFVDPCYRWSDPLLGKEIIRIWDDMKRHPRVFWAFDEASQGLDFTYNNKIIAASDATLTHCLSSPTAEALGGGKMAFWYEAGDKHNGVPFDNIPGLVVHGFEGLKRRLDQLLFQFSEAEKKEYLQTHIYGNLVPSPETSSFEKFKTLLAEN